MNGSEQRYIDEAFETNWIAPVGPHINAFEKEIADYIGVKGALAVSSGTAAIHLALILLDVKKGDTVFCSSLTFVASANPIVYQGAEPVFIDSEPETWNMSPEALKQALEEAYEANELPKAVIVVNLYGQSAKMEEITALCEEYEVPVIEDAAESLGATYGRRASGSFGKFGIFSFNGNKIITTSGGGMLVSDDTDALERAGFLATQARDRAAHYQHSQVGYNYRMSNILAGVGRGQFAILDQRVAQKRRVFERYFVELAHIPGVTFMPEPGGTMSNRWLTAITLDPEVCPVTPHDMLSALAEENIEARPVWKPLHLQPLFDKCRYYAHSDQSVSERLFETGICLPSGTNMPAEDQQRVISCVKSVFNMADLQEIRYATS
ncbi:DegT/DnrJ/EryC1/StrS family aminotransferase [Alteribacter natronophilus]|uniref:DegT/DnrJ/EryC1/StrS family aminotransferase n=1 Tax=Alteribacter natronophilus TaxID=2583810 RepID=UPI00110D81A2|nr:aminotransferase class I/II-fold pyridoxal phosphate-dependent enzyme [Alteribacter natronophilus]TMW70547.1 aminotransferase class I/II-fold pyridoxal phosphate-dependent enzyme [Alteribacter natronophilus]